MGGLLYTCFIVNFFLEIISTYEVCLDCSKEARHY
jgi:hypothetical protein